MVFLKEFFEKVENQQTTKKHAKLLIRQRINVMTLGLPQHLHGSHFSET